MQRYAETATQDGGEIKGGRSRYWVFWISSAAATIIFLLFMATMLMVPGVFPTSKIWMLSIAGVASAISLSVGVWRFGTTDAPVMDWPIGPVLGVILLIELAECILSVIQLSLRMAR